MCAQIDETVLAKRVAFLRQVPLFVGLNEHELFRLSRDGLPRDYKKGQVIFHQGDLSRELYVVMQGRVRVFKTAASGNETSINLFCPGDIVGEFATIDHQARSATAQAIVSCTLFQINGEHFLQYISEIPALALALARLLVGKVRWTAEYAETVAQYDAAGRLLHILLLYKDQWGEELEPEKRYLLNMGLNQADLASLVGVRRERVNRLLRDWAERGLLQYEAGKILILDLPRVERERDSHIEANLEHESW